MVFGEEINFEASRFAIFWIFCFAFFKLIWAQDPMQHFVVIIPRKFQAGGVPLVSMLGAHKLPNAPKENLVGMVIQFKQSNP
jgi:hypothetical protein